MEGSRATGSSRSGGKVPRRVAVSAVWSRPVRPERPRAAEALIARHSPDTAGMDRYAGENRCSPAEGGGAAEMQGRCSGDAGEMQRRCRGEVADDGQRMQRRCTLRVHLEYT